MRRAAFLSSSATLAAAAGVPALAAFPATLTKPPALRRGDRVGLIAPASPPEPGGVEKAIAHIESVGLTVVPGRYIHAKDGYLAGTDAERAADFNAMARDPAIRAIVAVRGGYGTMRILDALDYGALQSDPKVVMGYSDLTAILNAVTARSGLVTFHGPLGSHGSQWDGASREFIERTLFGGSALQPMHVPEMRRIVGGTAKGRLAGGNLSLIVALEGTPYAVPTHNALLFFEETEEAPYRIDRMLTQLALSGSLHAARGVVAGQCTKCTGDGPTPPASEVIDACLRANAKPAVAGALFGHIPTQWVLPIGCRAELDADARTLKLLEPAVSAR